MKRELILKNKAMAESLVAHFSTDKTKATLTEKESQFIVSYEIFADQNLDEKFNSFAQYLCEAMDRQSQYFAKQIDSMWDWAASHAQGHLPNLGPGGLNKLIKTAGLGDDYEVRPRALYASSEKSIEFSTEELRSALDKLNKEEPKQDEDVSRLMKVIQEQRK